MSRGGSVGLLQSGRRKDSPVASARALKLTRFGGQVDYAAIANTCVFNSNSIGLT
jgi:hypothetical protein